MLGLLGHILFYLVLAGGVLLTSLGAPGTWVILIASALYGWATGFAGVTPQILAILALIAVMLEVVEFLLAVKLAEKMGTGKKASWAAVAGAIIGGIWGTAIFPLIGSLIGVLAGAFLGATIWEMIQGKPSREVVKSGRGALIGRGGAVLIKTLGAATMVIIAVAA